MCSSDSLRAGEMGVPLASCAIDSFFWTEPWLNSAIGASAEGSPSWPGTVAIDKKKGAKRESYARDESMQWIIREYSGSMNTQRQQTNLGLCV